MAKTLNLKVLATTPCTVLAVNAQSPWLSLNYQALRK